jgi:hypothetical protein
MSTKRRAASFDADRPNTTNKACPKVTSNQNNGQTQKSAKLLDERPLIVLPSLARAVGVNGAIALQQLHFHLVTTGGREHKGHGWYYSTYEQWQKEDFPFWKGHYIRDLFQALEKRRLIINCQPESRKNRRKYYRIGHAALDQALAHAHAHGRTEIPSMEGRKFLPSLNKETYRKEKASGESLGSKAILKSKVCARAHGAFSLSLLKEGEAEIVKRFNKTFVPKGAQPVNKVTPALRRILRHCGWGDYTAFEKEALADIANWPRKRPGLVALWHAYKPFPKGRRSHRFPNKDIDELARWRNELRDESNALFRADPKGSEEERAEIEKQIQAVEAEWERRTGRSAEELCMKHGARRSEREHEAVKAKPIIPWLNGSEPNEQLKSKDRP